MESKYNKLIKNTAILSVGEFANKIMHFLIIPLYSYVLTTEEYGQIDLFTTSISMLLPVMTLQIQEGLLRFVLGKETSKEKAVGNCWLIFLLGSTVILLLFPVYVLVYESIVLATIFTALVLMGGFNTIFIHYLRVSDRMVEYAAKGVLGTFVNLLFNVLFVLVLRLGMNGYLYAMLISRFVGICYLLRICDLGQFLHVRYADKQVLKQMLKYSIPLIPNTLMWWVMSSGDKYVINYFLGDSANGLYSMALKIPTILALLYSFFSQAWQMVAIEEHGSADRKEFYEKIYKITNALLILMVSGIVLLVRPLYEIVLHERFTPAWVYVPLLSVSMVFSCQSRFFGVVYTTTKRTHKAFITTVWGAVLNLLFNFILIKPLGLHGVAIGTCLGYMTVVCIRGYDMRKEIRFSFDVKRLSASFIIILFQTMVNLCTDTMLNWQGFACLLALIILYREEILCILEVLKKKFCRTK